MPPHPKKKRKSKFGGLGIDIWISSNKWSYVYMMCRFICIISGDRKKCNARILKKRRCPLESIGVGIIKMFQKIYYHLQFRSGCSIFYWCNELEAAKCLHLLEVIFPRLHILSVEVATYLIKLKSNLSSPFPFTTPKKQGKKI